ISDPWAGPPGGESFAEVADRVGAARDSLLREHRGRTVLVVTHVTPIKVLVQQAMLAPLSALYRMYLDTACLNEVDYYADGPAVVRSLNDTAHLERGVLTQVQSGGARSGPGGRGSRQVRELEESPDSTGQGGR